MTFERHGLGATAPIVFPDVELWLCTYLRAELPAYGYTDVYCSNQRKTQTVAVWVRRDGGGPLDQVREAPRIGVNVFHTSEQRVTDLARTVAALIVAAADGDPVCKATNQSGPSPVADSSGPRRYMTFELVVRGTELEPVTP